jgi:Cytochrome c oxidase caa3 assembly factor (Caa3_CtaG)
MSSLFYWLEPWEPSPTVVIAVLLAAVLFARGARKARVSIARHVSFWFGLTALYVALHTRLDYFFEHEFFMHRLQHLVLHHLGPFFIALSYPGAALRAGIPFSWRQRWLKPVLDKPSARLALRVLFNPIVAVTLFVTRPAHSRGDRRDPAADHARCVHFLHAARAVSDLLDLRPCVHMDQSDARSADRRTVAVDSRFDDERDRRVDCHSALAEVIDA